MANEIDPGFAPGTNRRVITISIVFIVFGIVLFPIALSAFRSGQPISMLSNRRPIYGWEGLLISVLSVIIGIGGVWAVSRRRGSR